MPEWPGYEVSDAGRIRSVDRSIETVRGPRRVLGRVLRPRATTDGYRAVVLCDTGRQRSVRVHRAVLLAFDGPPPEGAEACHAPSPDPTDNRLINLRWCSRSENAFDSVAAGRHANARKGTCPRDHRLVAPNLCAWGVRAGARVCKACHRARSQAWRLRRAGVRVDEASLRVLADWHLDELVLDGRDAA